MRNFLLGFVILSTVLPGEIISLNSNLHTGYGFRLISETPSGMEIVFSLNEMTIDNIEINGIPMQKISIPGIFLPNNEGAPNLPGMGRYIAIPQGAQARVTILSKQIEVYHNLDIAPAHNIPLETDTMPLRYKKDMAIYGRNAYYPNNPVILSKPMKIRGVDAVIIGITPFQYNPMTKDLIVYKNLRGGLILSAVMVILAKTGYAVYTGSLFCRDTSLTTSPYPRLTLTCLVNSAMGMNTSLLYQTIQSLRRGQIP